MIDSCERMERIEIYRGLHDQAVLAYSPDSGDVVKREARGEIDRLLDVLCEIQREEDLHELNVIIGEADGSLL